MSDEKKSGWVKTKIFFKIMAGAIIISLGFSFYAGCYVLKPQFEVGLGIFLLLIGGVIFIKGIKEYLY